MNKLVNIIVRLLNAILKIFKGNKPSLTIPYPEQPANYAATMETVDIDAVITEWLTTYNVPEKYHNFWRNDCHITLSQQYTYAAATIAQTRTVYVRPEWCNAGVIAHEICHIVWYYLSTDEQKAFSYIFNEIRQHNALLALAWKTHSNMRKNIIESLTDNS